MELAIEIVNTPISMEIITVERKFGLKWTSPPH